MTSTNSLSHVLSVKPCSPTDVDTYVGMLLISSSPTTDVLPVALRLLGDASFPTPISPTRACVAGRLTHRGASLACLFALEGNSIYLARKICCADTVSCSVGRAAVYHAASYAPQFPLLVGVHGLP